jgi:protein SCO1/2
MEVTQSSFAGAYTLLYFGFTFCPEICPAELKKMAEAYEGVVQSKRLGNVKIVPVFIRSCSLPQCSFLQFTNFSVWIHGGTLSRLYVNMCLCSIRISLVSQGLWTKCKEYVEVPPERRSILCSFSDICLVLAFRVYSSKPTKAEVDGSVDYLVDHSVFMYLMGKDGSFLGYYGQVSREESPDGYGLPTHRLQL